MTNCTCPLAGWCERHKITKTAHFHHLCQTNPKYRRAWDKGIGPGQPTKELTQKQLETKLRIEESRKRTDRLIGWLTFFRHPDDRGVGDTAKRMLPTGKQSPDAGALIKRLLDQCACKQVDAVSRLNAEHPY